MDLLDIVSASSFYLLLHIASDIHYWSRLCFGLLSVSDLCTVRT